MDRYYMCEKFIRDALNCKTYAYNGFIDASNIERGELHRIKPIIAIAMYATIQNVSQGYNEQAENLLCELLQSDNRDEIIDIVETFKNEISGR